MITFLKIDGVDYSDLLIDWDIDMKILDGTAAGRMITWLMKRDPEGIILNYDITLYSIKENEPKIETLWNTLRSLGEKESVTVDAQIFGEEISQEMYANPGKLKPEKILDKRTTYAPWKIALIAIDRVG